MLVLNKRKGKKTLNKNYSEIKLQALSFKGAGSSILQASGSKNERLCGFARMLRIIKTTLSARRFSCEYQKFSNLSFSACILRFLGNNIKWFEDNKSREHNHLLFTEEQTKGIKTEEERGCHHLRRNTQPSLFRNKRIFNVY